MHRYLTKSLTGLGFSLVALSSLTAGNADDFELSIFAQTPIHVWIGIGGAIAIALVLAFGTDYRRSGILLAVLAVGTLVSMPLIRGYYFTGGDALIHLGFAKWILDGGPPMEVYYPGIHLTAIAISTAMDLPLRTALMTLTPLFFLLYVGAVPIAILRITGAESRVWPLVVGTFVALLLAPIDGITTHLSPHPSSFAILTFPFLIYLVVTYYRTNDLRIGLLLPLAYLFVVFLHPQQGMNFVLVLATIALAQIGMDKVRSGSFPSLQKTKWMGLQFGILLIIDFYYQIGRYKFRRSLVSAFEQFLSFQPGAESAARSASVNAIGRDFSILFLKVYGVSLALSILAGIVGLLVVYRILHRESTLEDHSTVYFLAAAVPLSIAFVFFFIASYEFMYLRYLGSILVLNSVVAAAGLVRLHDLTGWFDTPPRGVIAIGVAVLLAASLPAVLPSPYTLSSSQGTMEEYYVGYETAYTVQKPDTDMTYTRTFGPRYKSAIFGEQPNIHFITPPYHFGNQSLSTAYDSDSYLAISSYDRTVDVKLYNEYRYTREDFAYLENDSDISNVVSNGEFDLYLVDATPNS